MAGRILTPADFNINPANNNGNIRLIMNDESQRNISPADLVNLINSNDQAQRARRNLIDQFHFTPVDNNVKVGLFLRGQDIRNRLVFPPAPFTPITLPPVSGGLLVLDANTTYLVILSRQGNANIAAYQMIFTIPQVLDADLVLLGANVLPGIPVVVPGHPANGVPGAAGAAVAVAGVAGAAAPAAGLFIGGNNYYGKYLKYKQKYIALKSDLLLRNP